MLGFDLVWTLLTLRLVLQLGPTLFCQRAFSGREIAFGRFCHGPASLWFRFMIRMSVSLCVCHCVL